MKCRAFYNEIDPGKAETIRQLMARGVIMEGDVDERSILEIHPDELLGYTQCHFFAGFAIWSYALRLGGWKDEWPCWTGSCPCQPFSVAGKQKGALDERHLWPAWFRLIAQRRPRVVFGEQVADGDGITWLDAVQADLESAGYRTGPLVLPAAGFGAPHGRHRIMFVADAREERIRASRSGSIERAPGATEGGAQERERVRTDFGECSAIKQLADNNSERLEGQRLLLQSGQSRQASPETSGSSAASGLGHAGSMAEPIQSERRGRPPDARRQQPDGRATGRNENASDPERHCKAGELADAKNPDGGGELKSGESHEHGRSGLTGDGEARDGVVQDDPITARLEGHGGNVENRHQPGRVGAGTARPTAKAGPANGYWSNALWLPCSDDKFRPVEPVPVAMADGLANSLGRVCDSGGQSYFHPLQSKAPAKKLRLIGYGDGIVAPAIAAFVRAYIEIEGLK